MKTGEILRRLRAYESRNVTFIEPDGSWPIVWDRAKGVFVWDQDGRKYLDWTAAFGVAASGHGNWSVVRAGQRQMSRLLHAMGDVHPHARKAELARELSRLTFERWSRMGLGARKGRGKVIFCNSGFEAVEAALKTALLATGKEGVVAFSGAYHGLGYGALNVTHRDHFRGRFRGQLGNFSGFVPFPVRTEDLDEIRGLIGRMLGERPVGAILVEPIQGRAGINIPPVGFLPMLREICDREGCLLIFDEVFTGFGRTGKWFACEHWGVVPDLICLGKAITGGFPLSACVGKAGLMDGAWPESTGEAIHTSTYLGHPVGCAMALAQIVVLKAERLSERSAVLGRILLRGLRQLKGAEGLKMEARGLGLMAGLELRLEGGEPASGLTWKIVKKMLLLGYLLLPEGEHGNILAFTPPLTISVEQIEKTIAAVQREIDALVPCRGDAVNKLPAAGGRGKKLPGKEMRNAPNLAGLKRRLSRSAN